MFLHYINCRAMAWVSMQLYEAEILMKANQIRYSFKVLFIWYFFIISATCTGALDLLHSTSQILYALCSNWFQVFWVSIQVQAFVWIWFFLLAFYVLKIKNLLFACIPICIHVYTQIHKMPAMHVIVKNFPIYLIAQVSCMYAYLN